MENAELKVIKFDNNDVIATSGYLQVTNSFNKSSSPDNVYTFGGKTYGSSDLNEEMFNNYFGEGAWGAKLPGTGTFFVASGVSSMVELDLSDSDKLNRDRGNMYDTTYYWNNTAWIRQ